MTLTTWAMRSVYVDHVEWFDKVNGNTYFSARVYVDGSEVARLPFQYGYGSHVEFVAAQALHVMGIVQTDEPEFLRIQHLRMCGVDVYMSHRTATKRETVAHGANITSPGRSHVMRSGIATEVNA